MKNFFSYCFLLGIVLIISCNKPKAVFTTSHETAYVGELITFTNESKKGFFYEWDFGDGAFSAETSPKHLYAHVGSYIVKLKTTNKHERKPSYAYKMILIKDIPFKYEGSIGGLPEKWMVDAAGKSTISIANVFNTLGSPYSAVYNSTINNGNRKLSIDWGVLSYSTVNPLPDVSIFRNFITKQTLNYINGTTITNGVEIKYFDGVQWSSKLGLQSSSACVVDTVVYVLNATNQQTAEARLNFNCLVYDGFGNSKSIYGFVKTYFANIP